MTTNRTSNADPVIDQIRVLLRRDKVKLWEKPYTADDGKAAEIPTKLSITYANELSISPEKVLTYLESFRENAVKKLRAKITFEKEGLATVTVKFIGDLETQNLVKEFEISLKSTINQLKMVVGQFLDKDTSLLKIIYSGKLLDETQTLIESKIKNFSHLLTVVMPKSIGDAERNHKMLENANKTRVAAEILSNMDDDMLEENYMLQLSDQHGKALNLPDEERRSLLLAMILQEKGRSLLKKKEYSQAIILLLDSDREFKKGKSEILEVVDNYGMLCLDIVWCYLCLNDVSNLPDAKEKLSTAEKCFTISYGPNLERLSLIKESISNERSLFMRLHLLQGIVHYHQGNNQLALNLLNMASEELSKLDVDDSKVAEIMELGFTVQEARINLRESENNLPIAVAKIEEKREAKKQRKEKEEKERGDKKLEKLLGKTANGQQFVSKDMYHKMKSMGVPNGAAKEALRLSNNNLTEALEILNKKPELYAVWNPEEPKKITRHMIAQVESAGFSAELSEKMLRQTNGDKEKAIKLLKKNAEMPLQKGDELYEKIYKDLLPDISHDFEDYLDINLDQESIFLNEYLQKLSAT